MPFRNRHAHSVKLVNYRISLFTWTERCMLAAIISLVMSRVLITQWLITCRYLCCSIHSCYTVLIYVVLRVVSVPCRPSDLLALSPLAIKTFHGFPTFSTSLMRYDSPAARDACLVACLLSGCFSFTFCLFSYH